MYYPDENGSPSSSCSEPSDEHEDLFRTKVQALWQEECFIDVTLACDDKILTAHKLVLSAYSDYFKRIFSSLKYNQHPVVFMKDVSFDVLQAVLEFMYCGEVNVAQYNLRSFMKTARNLKIKGLSMDGDDIEERESPQRKRKRSSQGSPADNRPMMLSPPVKKKKAPYPMKGQNYFEEEDDEIDDKNGAYWDEEGVNMPSNYGKKSKYPPQQRPPQQGYSHHRYENDNVQQIRKRNNSFGNTSHSSQQSRMSSFKPVARPFQGPIMTNPSSSSRPRQRIKEDPLQAPISDQNYSENEEMAENNLDESFTKSSQIAGLRSQNASWMLVDSPQEDGKKPIHPFKEDLFSMPDMETRLTRLIVYMSQIIPLSISQVKTFAWSLDSVHGGNHFDENGPTKSWWTSFRNKYPKMKNILRNSDFLKPNQLSSSKFSFSAINDYLTPVQETIEAFALNESPENFWSCDEYSINLSNSATPGQPIIRPARERFMHSSSFSAKDNFASVMICGSASGKKLPPFTVFKNLAPDEDSTRNGPSDAMYDQTSSGFFDSDTLLKWFEDCFLPTCPASRSEDNPVILLMNSLLPLVSQEMLDMAIAENVILLSLTPHLHHACQPMDVSFIKGFRKTLQEKIQANGFHGDELKDALPSLLTDSYNKKITSNLLKDGFRICGIFPLLGTISKEEYMNLTSNLGFDQLVTTSLGVDENVDSEKATSTKRLSKLLPKKTSDDINTSDEEETFGEEDSNSCYVCGKEYLKEGKKQQEKWLKCFKKHCGNLSCEECLPLNCVPGGEFYCIDCSKH